MDQNPSDDANIKYFLMFTLLLILIVFTFIYTYIQFDNLSKASEGDYCLAWGNSEKTLYREDLYGNCFSEELGQKTCDWTIDNITQELDIFPNEKSPLQGYWKSHYPCLLWTQTQGVIE